MKQSSTEAQASYLAVVTNLEQIRVHCPLCILNALSQALLEAMTHHHAKPGAVASVAGRLHELSMAVEILMVGEIDTAMLLLMKNLRDEFGEHYQDIPF